MLGLISRRLRFTSTSIVTGAFWALADAEQSSSIAMTGRCHARCFVLNISRAPFLVFLSGRKIQLEAVKCARFMPQCAHRFARPFKRSEGMIEDKERHCGQPHRATS